MLVKCRACGNQIEKNEAYKVSKNKVNYYYCNKEEYMNIYNQKQIKDNVYNEINDIFGYKITNTALYKEINEIHQIYTYEQIISYLKANHQYLSDVLNKEFKSEFAKIRYFSAILRNSLKDFIIEENKKEIRKEINIEITQNNYKPKTRRKSMTDFEDEVTE